MERLPPPLASSASAFWIPVIVSSSSRFAAGPFSAAPGTIPPGTLAPLFVDLNAAGRTTLSASGLAFSAPPFGIV